VKIERAMVNRMSLEAFADKHDLTMELHERTRTDLHPSFGFAPNRFYAHFKNSDTKDGSVLCGTFGNGGTEYAALVEYATAISGKLLVIDAYKECRREIYVPELYVDASTLSNDAVKTKTAQA